MIRGAGYVQRDSVLPLSAALFATLHPELLQAAAHCSSIQPMQ